MTQHTTYDMARDQYVGLQKAGFKVVLRRPVNGREKYEVRVI